MEPGVSTSRSNRDPVVREVTLPAGETTDLGDILVGNEQARYFKLTVRNERGESLDGEVAYRATSNDGDRRRTRVARGDARFVTPAPELDIVVYAKGYRTAEMTNVSSGTVVVLKPALRVEIHANLRELPADCVVSIDCRRDRRLNRFGRLRSRFEPNGVAVARLPGPGRYRITARVFHRDDQRSRDHRIDHEAIEIDVEDLADQTVRIRFDHKAIESVRHWADKWQRLRGKR